MEVGPWHSQQKIQNFPRYSLYEFFYMILDVFTGYERAERLHHKYLANEN
jgi:hypothetical protein